MFYSEKLVGARLFLLSCILVLFGFFVFTACLNMNIAQDVIIQSNHNNTHPFGEITVDNSIKQTIPMKFNSSLVAIKLLLATYARNNTSDVQIEVKDINGNTIAENKVNAKDILDNSYYTVNFNKNYSKFKPDELIITISSDNATSGNAITAWLNSENQIIYSLSKIDNFTAYIYATIAFICMLLLCCVWKIKNFDLNYVHMPYFNKNTSRGN